MKKSIVMLAIVALVAPTTLAFAAKGGGARSMGVKGPTAPKSQAYENINGDTLPPGLASQSKTPPGFSNGNKNGFISDPNKEPFGYDRGTGNGWGK